MIRVDSAMCDAVAALLARVAVPAADEEGPLSVPRELVPNFYFAIVAICHQTSPRLGTQLSGRLSSGHTAVGWDYLRLRFADRAAVDQHLLMPSVWSQLSAGRVEELFEDDDRHRTLSHCDERARLLRNLGSRSVDLGFVDVTELFRRNDRYLGSGATPGLFADLASFEAYRDPIKKKSCFFLELMRNQARWVYRDTENLGAPVDYHEVRGHLRLGTVKIDNKDLVRRLQFESDVTDSEDLAIRGAVYNAIQRISQTVGTTEPATLHYLFWNVFRACCQRDIQHCHECGPSCSLPARYRSAFNEVQAHGCVFASVCSSAGRPDKLLEHSHTTDFY